MTNSIIEIPEVAVQLPDWRIMLRLNVWMYVQMWELKVIYTRCLLTQHWVNVRV